VPQGQILGIPTLTGISEFKNICKNSVDNIWLKEPMFDNVDDLYDDNLILSNERYTQIWNIIEEEIDKYKNDNEYLRNLYDELGIEKSALHAMTNNDIKTYIFENFNGEKLDRLKELWLRNSDNISLIELRPMILTLNEDEKLGLYLCDRITHTTGIIMNDNEIKQYNNNDINISLENTFQLIENTLKKNHQNPSEFNISMLVCRNNCGEPADIFNFTTNDYVNTYKSKSTGASTKLGGENTNPENINVVNVSEDELYKYLSVGGSIHKKKRKNKTKRKTKRKTKKKRKRI
jgi:hypothetical protein